MDRIKRVVIFGNIKANWIKPFQGLETILEPFVCISVHPPIPGQRGQRLWEPEPAGGRLRDHARASARATLASESHFFHLISKLRTHFYVPLTYGAARIFPDSYAATGNQTRISSVAPLLRDLNPGHFYWLSNRDCGNTWSPLINDQQSPWCFFTIGSILLIELSGYLTLRQFVPWQLAPWQLVPGNWPPRHPIHKFRQLVPYT